jgi:amidase
MVVLGKSTLPEFGLSMSTEYMTRPPTRNPWNPAYSSGASSGGAAALVAAGVVPIAHANDGGGSIRIPAACCGLVGLKPTRGRFRPGHTERVMPVNIAVEGVVTRTVRDTARFYEAAESLYRAPGLPGIGGVDGPGTRRLRVGLVVDSITGTVTDPETRRVVTEVAELLASLGHDVVEMSPPVPDRFEEDFVGYWKFFGFMLRHFTRQIYGVKVDASRFDGLTRGLAASYPRIAHRSPAGFVRLRRSDRQYAKTFREWDVVLSPVLARTVPELGWLSPTLPFDVLFPRLREIVAFTPLNNATGSPAMSLPLGMSSAGLPIGMQLSAAHGHERLLLELAYELEDARPFARIQDEMAADR